MHYLDYNEQIRHQTGDLPMAYYHVDERHPRYYMRMHWHRETELIHVRSGLLHLYVGDGEVIEAMGTAYGVVRTQLAERSWTAWLEIPYISYD